MISLFIEYYISENSERQAELDFCLQHNLNNEHIDHVYLFYNKNECRIQHKKIVFVKINRRLCYSDFFQFIKDKRFPPRDVFILANSDIHFDHSLRSLHSIDLTGRAICLTRYDNGRLHGCPKESQDAWIINASAIPPQLILDSMFTLGVPGCDNRIAYLFNQYGLEPYNPCIDIKCYHKHASNFRTYGTEDRIQGPYLLVGESRLNQLKKRR